MNADSAFVKTLLDSSSDSAASSFDEELFNNSSSSSSSLGSEPKEHPKVDNFIAVVEMYSDMDFKKHFRLERSTALYLINRYNMSSFFNTLPHGGSIKIGACKGIYMFLWYMANTNTFREVGNLFGVSISSAWRSLQRVVAWLISFGHEFIKWPNASKADEIMTKFEAMKNIPGVLGCIDCSHIKIKAPRDSKEAYFNRKHYYSLHLQGVVDADKMFIDVFVGEPGSLHDSQVLRRSSLYRRSLDNEQQTFPNNSFLLGDSAYPAMNWLVSPFRDNGSLNSSQRQFNFLHSSTRIVVENAFGMLKTRFRRLLHFSEQVNLVSITNLIVCGCILHNICLSKNDVIVEQTVNDEGNDEQNALGTEQSQIGSFTLGGNRREQLVAHLANNNKIRI